MDDRESHPQKELLNKVLELNKKIEELQKGSGKHIVSLDFANSDNIVEIESGIKDTMDGIILSKAALCKALANIDKKRLYTQVGADNFLEYLDMSRIPINYKTAKEYAKIGDTMLRYDKELTTVNFQEEDGLKKLVYLDKALDRCPEDPESVFQKVKESSLRDFQHWIQELKAEKPEIPKSGPGYQYDSDGHLTVDQEGNPYSCFIVDGNTIYRCDGPVKKDPVVILKPEILGIDGSNEKWLALLDSVIELLEQLRQSGASHDR